MKKRLILIVCCVLVLVLCASALISCKKDNIDEATLELLLESAKGNYGETGTVTDNFTVSGTVTRYDEEKDEMVEVYVKWTPGVSSVTTTEADGVVTVILPETRTEDLTFTLTAVLVNANGAAYKRADGTEYTFTITRTAKETNSSMIAANSFYGKVVKEPQAGVAYKAVVFKEYTAWYFAGTTESGVTYRYNTTFKYNESPDVYIEQAEGGFYLYFMNGTTKTYIDTFNQSGKTTASTGLVTDATKLQGVYTMHETGALVAKCGNYTFYLGMRGQYLPSISAITDTKPLNDGTNATGYKYTDNPVFLVSEDVSYEQETLTEEQVLAKAKALGDNEELAGRYSLTGVVTQVVTSGTYTDLDVYMNLSLDGTEILCYRLTKGSSLHVGDTVKVTGVLKKYKADDADAIIEFIAYGHYELIKKAPVDVPSNVDKVTTPVADTAYLITINQEGLSTPAQIYLVSEMSGNYVKTTNDRFGGVKFYVEAVTGGYKIYCLDGTDKNYLGISASNSKYLAFGVETVWTIDADGIHLTVDGTEYYIGTNGTYTTIGSYTDSADVWKAFLGTLKADKVNAVISVTDNANAEITVDKTSAAIGDTVTITVTPNDGYVIDMVKVNGKTIEAVAGVYSFEVTGDSTVSAVIKEEGLEETTKDIELTLESMNVASGYSSKEPTEITIGGLNLEYIGLGNYGDGLQWRTNTGTGTTAIYNTESAGVIVSIKFVPNKKQDLTKTNNLKIEYGATDALGKSQLVTLTADGVTITFDADTKYFKISHNNQGAVYLDSIVITVEKESGTPASADNSVAKIGETGYEALAAAQANDTIVMQKDDVIA